MNIIKKRKLGRGVAMVGAGLCKFGSYKDKTIRELLVDAFLDMCQSVDKGIDKNEIETMYFSTAMSEYFEWQSHTAPIMSSWLGLVPRAATRIENACASGGVALRHGAMAIASGLYDIVLVGGYERMTATPIDKTTEFLATAGDRFYEAVAGFTFPGLYAAMATAHMHKYGTKIEHFMKIAMKNYSNGALNPKAQFNSTLGDIMKIRIARCQEKQQPVPTWKDEMAFLNDSEVNPVIAWPMRLFDCAPVTDGAACALLVSEEIAKNFTDDPIYIVGTGQGSDHALHEREDITSLLGVKVAAQEAYQMANIKPENINLAEVHDCFTIAEIIATEDLGFFKPGQGSAAIDTGVTTRTGAKPINTSGGLKAKGHPVGASGVAQAIEIWLQLREKAGARQIPKRDLSLGLTHNVGATGGSCVVNIFERR